MSIYRLIETTLFLPDRNVSALFVPVWPPLTELPETTELIHELYIRPYWEFGLDEGNEGIADEALQELLHVSAGALLAVPEDDHMALPPPDYPDAGSFVEKLASRGRALEASDDTKIAFAALFYTPNIIIEASPPQLADLVSIMKSGSGAVIGAYTGYAVAHAAMPVLLLVTVPTGMLICASAMGLASGIEQGLKVAAYKWVTRRKSNPSSRLGGRRGAVASRPGSSQKS